MPPNDWFNYTGLLVAFGFGVLLILGFAVTRKMRRGRFMEPKHEDENSSFDVPELDIRGLLTPLAEDADQLLEILARDRSSQFARRNYVRAVSAFIEAWINSTKNLCRSAAGVAITPFSEAELALLRDVSFELSDRGEAIEKPKFMKFDQNFRFAFASYAKLHGSELKLPTAEQGWELLRQFVKVRNRLTHPRNLADLTVSDDELRNIEKATDWFRGVTRDLNADAIKSYAAKRKSRGARAIPAV